MKFLLLIMCTASAALTSSAALGAVVFETTDPDNVLRPVSVTGLSVNGVLYDVAIAYSVGINGNNTANLLGALPDNDADDAAIALEAAIDTAAEATDTDSNETIIYLLSNTQSGMGGGADFLARLEDTTAGVAGGFTVLLSNGDVTIFRSNRGAATFAIAPVPAIPPVPEPSSTAICATIAVSVMLRRRRRRRAGETTGP